MIKLYKCPVRGAGSSTRQTHKQTEALFWGPKLIQGKEKTSTKALEMILLLVRARKPLSDSTRLVLVEICVVIECKHSFGIVRVCLN